jgi:hypothetical protein
MQKTEDREKFICLHTEKHNIRAGRAKKTMNIKN